MLPAGETGEISYASRWREYDIMFHIAPLMPCREHDTQQVHRKRHIGNGNLKKKDKLKTA